MLVKNLPQGRINMNLDKYLFKNVRLTFSDGQILVGYIDDVTEAYDNENNEQSMTIIPAEGSLKGRPVEVFKSEIETVS